MKNLMMGLVAVAVLALGGAASADDSNCGGMGCDGYNIRLTVNGNPYYGKWAIVNDRPYVGIEAFSDYMGVPRAHYYKGWSFAKTPSENISPLDLQVLTEDKKVDTIRFAGVTMVDLYRTAEALDVPVHHDFRKKIIQVGNTGYVGENMKGKWYRHLNRVRGWTDHDWLERMTKSRRFEWEPDHGPEPIRRL
jgi:hypothetical protein